MIDCSSDERRAFREHCCQRFAIRGVRLIVLIPVTVFYRPVPPKCPCVQLFCQDSPPDPSCILRNGRRRQGLVAKNRTQGNSQDAFDSPRERIREDMRSMIRKRGYERRNQLVLPGLLSVNQKNAQIGYFIAMQSFREK